MTGRNAVRGSPSSLHIETATIGTLKVDRAHFNLSLLILELERELDDVDASPEVKEEARTKLASLRAHADTLATGAAGSVISQVLLRVLGTSRWP